MVFLVPTTAPSAPTGLNAVIANAYQVNLTWTDTSANEIGFRIERATGTGAFAPFMSVPANTVAFSDTTVVPGTTYSYQVIAFNSAGDSSPSNTATVVLPPAVPKAPTSLTATAIGPQQVNLAWVDNSNNESGFRIERATGTGVGIIFVPVTTVGANVATFSDTTVQPGTTYTYRVFAYNAIGDSLPSNLATAATPQVPPAAPSGLAATAISAHQVNLTWTDGSNNEAGFRIERATGAGAFAAIGTVGANLTAYSDMTAAPATTYSYRVFAYNSAGDSPPSNSATATTPDVPPTAPSGLAATAIGPHQINLGWTDTSNNESGFRIQRATGGGAFATIATLGANVTAYSDTTLNTVTTYSYRVFAYNIIGNSPFSNTATATTPALPGPPTAPTSLTATLSPLSSSAPTVTLKWQDNANNETSFSIQRATNAGFSAGLTIFTVGANATTYTDSSVTLNTTYYYHVKAVNSYGSSAFTNTASVTTPRTLLPANPTNLLFVSSTRFAISMSWTDNAANEQGFYVFRSTAGANGPWTLARTVLPKLASAPSTVTFTNTLLKRGTNYWYKVSAFNTAGASGNTNTISAATKP